MAVANSWPWIVNFISKRDLRQYCAGSIIDREWILTAAHCFLYDEVPLPSSAYTYHVGDHRLNFSDTGEYTVKVSHAFCHPQVIIGDYDGPGENDIALLRLETPFIYDANVLPVCLREKTSSFVKDSCYVIGWGKTRGVGKDRRSSLLKQGQVDLV